MRIPSFGQIKALFTNRARPNAMQRGYRDMVAAGGANSDWVVAQVSEDADVWMNSYLLTSRMRDLFKTNPLYIKYRELLWANVFGEQGIMLRMKIQETENRVVNTPDEKAYLVAHERRINRVREWAANKAGNRYEEYRAFKLADGLESRDLDTVLRGQAMIQVGAPDVFANQRVEAWWKDWQRAENCDVRGRRNYKVLRQLRLISAVRDGDHFIRMVKDPRVNAHGYTLQLINAEWCDRFYNATLPNGNEVRMGMEYEKTSWGLGKWVAAYFIKRQPLDWQFSVPGMFNFTAGNLHDRVDSSELIHYARAVDSDGTRPAPWCASTIPKARQLDQYELAEVITAREQACKTGFYFSDVVAENNPAEISPGTGIPTEAMGPGETRALPWGWQYKERNPTHPNGNFETFRKGMSRSITAGMPGADYNMLANDLENINFSAGRLGRLDTNEISKNLQCFDIDTAERPIFENGLEMALIVGIIPLPYSKAKFAKFNKAEFQGRRWFQVDEVKQETASALRIANKKSSRGRECAENGVDFEEIAFELAEEEMLLESLGMSGKTTVEAGAPTMDPAQDSEQDDEDAEETEDDDTTKPKKAPVNGKKKPKLGKGARFVVKA